MFNNLVRQQITAWTTLRNHADHGNFDQYTAQQVGSLIGACAPSWQTISVEAAVVRRTPS